MALHSGKQLLLLLICAVLPLASTSPLFSNFTRTCTTVRSMLRTSYHIFASQQYRGAPRQLFEKVYATAVASVTRHVKEDHDASTRLGDACLTTEEINGLHWNALHDRSSVFTAAQIKLEYTTDVTRTSVTSLDGAGSAFVTNASSFRHRLLPGVSRSATLFAVPSNTSVQTSYVFSGCEAAQNELLGMHNSVWAGRAASVFYLPPNEDAWEKVPPMSAYVYNSVMTAWDSADKELQKAARDVEEDKILGLPSTVEIFYDPKRAQMQAECDRVRGVGSNITANDLVYRVAGISVRLRDEGVSADDSLIVLNHTVAYAFACARAHGKDGDDLMLTDAYIPFYESMFYNLTNGKRLRRFNEISVDAMKKHYGDELSMLSRLDAWGMLKYPRFGANGDVRYVDVKDVLFDSAKMAAVTRASTTLRPLGKAVHSPSSSLLRPSARGAGDVTCRSSFYELPNATVVVSQEERCCANVCKAIDQITNVGMSCEVECCGWCNQWSCVLDSTNPLTPVVNIMLQEYGWYTGCPVTLNIFGGSY